MGPNHCPKHCVWRAPRIRHRLSRFFACSSPLLPLPSLPPSPSCSRPSLAALPLPHLSLPLAAALYHTSTEHKASDGTTLSGHLRRSRQHHAPRATTLRCDGARSCMIAQLAVYCVGFIARRYRVQAQDVQSNQWKTWRQLYRRGFIETDFILLRSRIPCVEARVTRFLHG